MNGKRNESTHPMETKQQTIPPHGLGIMGGCIDALTVDGFAFFLESCFCTFPRTL